MRDLRNIARLQLRDECGQIAAPVAAAGQICGRVEVGKAEEFEHGAAFLGAAMKEHPASLFVSALKADLSVESLSCIKAALWQVGCRGTGHRRVLMTLPPSWKAR
jgi:hypothetical protein